MDITWKNKIRRFQQLGILLYKKPERQKPKSPKQETSWQIN